MEYCDHKVSKNVFCHRCHSEKKDSKTNSSMIEDIVATNGVLDAGDKPDMINEPPHYTCHPSGIEPITLTQHMNFCTGNVVKYVMRADYKGKPLEDLEKARFYLDLEIKRRKEK